MGGARDEKNGGMHRLAASMSLSEYRESQATVLLCLYLGFRLALLLWPYLVFRPSGSSGERLGSTGEGFYDLGWIG